MLKITNHIDMGSSALSGKKASGIKSKQTIESITPAAKLNIELSVFIDIPLNKEHASPPNAGATAPTKIAIITIPNIAINFLFIT